MKSIEEKTCENCTHYVQHYIKQNFRFKKISDGHCAKRVGLKKMPKFCERWECQSSECQEESFQLKTVFEKMLKRLNEIAVFLNESE